MDFCLSTLLALVLICATASSAPLGARHVCQDARRSSLELSHFAKSAAAEAKHGSPDLARFSSSLPFMEAKDMCDPDSLKLKPMQCVGKILDVLKDYSFAVNWISSFQSCRTAAAKVAPALEKLQGGMSKCVRSLGGLTQSLDHHFQEDAQPVDDWEEPLVCRYILERLFSFSILTARVFATGDPSHHHSNASVQKCS